jgi:hypothetical protein
MRNGGITAAQAIDLCPARDTALYVVPRHIGSAGAARSNHLEQTLASACARRNHFDRMDPGIDARPNQLERFGIPREEWASASCRLG